MILTGCFSPRVAATGKIVPLAMQRLWLTGQVLPAGARLTVQHVFQSAADGPLEVIYCFALPRDAAMRAFRITGEGFESHSELRATEAAVKEYERGIAHGSLSALARLHGDGAVNLTVGNIRPGETVTVYLDILAGVELRDDGFRFRFPFTLAPSYHPLAKFAVTGPGEGELELPPDVFGDVILPPYRWDAAALHQVGFDLTVTSPLEIDELGSPTHGVRVRREHGGQNRVALAPENDIPNRDLVLDAHFSAVTPQVLGGRSSDGTRRFAAIVPSSSFGSNPNTPRRTVILLDHSGSMEGTRLAQATRAIKACLGALAETDQFGLVAFSSAAKAFHSKLLPGSRKNRDKAHRFLETVTADGGTELANGFQAAVEVLGPGRGDVLIFTDGEVFGTEEILAKALATGTRLHCLGIGGASQDRFLALLARQTGGVSRYVTPEERVDLAAVDLFASAGRPVASGLKATTTGVQPEPPACVFSGTPVMLFCQTGDDELALTWDGGGSLRLPLLSEDASQGETVRLLQGARLITDWESRYPSVKALAPLEKRRENRISARLLELSSTYGLASREMSLVAVVQRTGDRPGELPETLVVPVGGDLDFEDADTTGSFCTLHSPSAEDFLDDSAMEEDSDSDEGSPPTYKGLGLIQSVLGRFVRPAAAPKQARPQSPEDLLLALAAALEGDGGMAGDNADERARLTTFALCAFLEQGHTPRSGAFRSHVERIVNFLASIKGLDANRRRLVDAILDYARRGEPVPGKWAQLAPSDRGRWEEIENSIAPAGKSQRQ